MKTSLKWISMLCCCLLICTGSAMAASTEKPSQNEAGMPLIPDFSLPTMDGGTFTLSEAQGKKVLLNFWATWCGYCVQEMPYFQEVYEKYGGEDGDIVVLMVDLADGMQETREMAQAFVEENGFSFPVAFDEDAAAYLMFSESGSIPITVLIDEEGYLMDGALGAVTHDQLFEMIGKSSNVKALPES